MSGETQLGTLLASLQPRLLEEEYVFCSVPDLRYGDLTELKPLASFQEDEGLSLIVERSSAEAEGLAFESVFRVITLSVHSSLDAVGLTAAVASSLADKGISANMVAAHFHDHVLVPSEKAGEALDALLALAVSVA